MNKFLGYLYIVLLNILAPFVAVIYVLWFLLSARRGLLKNLNKELKERFVAYNVDGFEGCMWVHASSAGEVLAIKQFLALINQNFPNRKILVTTTTALGKKIAKDKLNNLHNIKTIIAPLDFAPLIYRFTKIFKPHALIIIEKELWPNMILGAKSSGSKVILANANMSARSFKKYKLVKPMFKILFSKVDGASFQNKAVQSRFKELGLTTKKQKVLGNIKYDNLEESPKTLDILKILNWQDKQILTCGSTHQQEEEIIFKATQNLNLKTIIAPRHLERLPSITKNLQEIGLNFALLSQVQAKIIGKEPQVLIADKIGYLSSLYDMSNICFVGGTIADKGGHNLLEPAILGKPLIFGKNTYNLKDIAKDLEKNGAKIVDKNNFETTIKNINSNSADKIKQTALKYKGVSKKSVNFIKEIIK